MILPNNGCVSFFSSFPHSRHTHREKFLFLVSFISPAMLIFIAATLVLQRQKQEERIVQNILSLMCEFLLLLLLLFLSFDRSFDSFISKPTRFVQFPKRQPNLLAIPRVFLSFFLLFCWCVCFHSLQFVSALHSCISSLSLWLEPSDTAK